MLLIANPSLAKEVTVSSSSNLVEVRSLLFDITEDICSKIPVSKSSVVLKPSASHEANDLFIEALTQNLSLSGHTVLLDVQPAPGSQEDTEFITPVGEYLISFNMKEIILSYPEVGRKFGLWKQWIDRDLSVTVHSRILKVDTGVVLFDRLIITSIYDRIDAVNFEAIESNTYSFTNSEVSENGLRRVFEQVVVVGALSAMIAAYFSNTGSQ
jgi:hypothetical protein